MIMAMNKVGVRPDDSKANLQKHGACTCWFWFQDASLSPADAWEPVNKRY